MKYYNHPDAICTEDDCDRIVECSDRAWDAGIRKCLLHWTREGGFTAGPICIEDYFTVMAQWMPRNRWNGWLMPMLDPHGVMVAAGYLFDSTDENDTTTLRWLDDLSLEITEHDGDETYVEILHPDADGLYPLGAGSWVWQEEQYFCSECDSEIAYDATRCDNCGSDHTPFTVPQIGI